MTQRIMTAKTKKKYYTEDWQLLEELGPELPRPWRPNVCAGREKEYNSKVSRKRKAYHSFSIFNHGMDLDLLSLLGTTWGLDPHETAIYIHPSEITKYVGLTTRR